MLGSKRKTEVKRQRKIRFEFTVDRFGHSPQESATRVGYARNVIYALEHWAETVQLVFGNIETALDWAGQARILARYPSWSTTTDAMERVKTQLGLAALGGRAATARIGEGESGGYPTSADADDIVDEATRTALEQLRQCLGVLYEWA